MCMCLGLCRYKAQDGPLILHPLTDGERRPAIPNPKKALRLHEAVRKAEVEVSGKYVELVDKLREESTEELGRQVRLRLRLRLYVCLRIFFL